MSEMALTADHVIVVGRGRLITDAPTEDLVARTSGARVRVVTPDLDLLQPALGRAGATVQADGDGAVLVTGLTAAHIGDLARDHGCAVHELFQERASLEEAFMALTRDSVEYQPTPAGLEATEGELV
jgi:ABC-2 type transport system ATP-binding protein